MIGKHIIRKFIKTSLFVFAGFAILLLMLYFLFNAYRGSVSTWQKQNVQIEQVLTKKQAADDLRYIKEKVNQLHYSARNGLPKNFEKQYEYEIEHLSSKPTVLKVWQAGSRILQTLDDAHSTLYAYIDDRSYKNIDYSLNNNELFININKNQYKVNKINGASINVLMKNAYSQISYENDIYRDYEFISSLKHESEIEWLGSPSFNTYTVEYVDNGDAKNITFQPDNVSSKSSTNWVYFQIDKANNVGIFTLKRCNYNDEYKQVLNNFFAAVRKNHITNIAVDLRENSGGSSLVANEFIRYLNVDQFKDYTSYYRLKIISGKSPFNTIKNKKISSLLFNDKVYVLTSPKTFSSAMNFSVLLQDNKLAKVIGEPCGNKPSQYGEVVTFLLPDSKLYFSTTIAYFERPDKSIAGASFQVPDYSVPYKDALYKLYELTKGAT